MFKAYESYKSFIATKLHGMFNPVRFEENYINKDEIIHMRKAWLIKTYNFKNKCFSRDASFYFKHHYMLTSRDTLLEG